MLNKEPEDILKQIDEEVQKEMEAEFDKQEKSLLGEALRAEVQPEFNQDSILRSNKVSFDDTKSKEEVK